MPTNTETSLTKKVWTLATTLAGLELISQYESTLKRLSEEEKSGNIANAVVRLKELMTGIEE